MTALVENEISFEEVLLALKHSKWLILTCTSMFVVAAALLAWIFPRTYEATVVISPVSSSSSNGLSGGLSSAASQFGGLAALVGISTQGDSKKAESLAVLQSEALTEKYIQQNNLLPVLFPKQIDRRTGKWKATDPTKHPTLWKANQLFKNKIRTVTSDTKTGLSSLTISWSDPATAARWANDLVERANDYLRDQAIHESENNIVYLTEQASKTDVLGVKQAIYEILQSEISKVMLARGNEQFALKVIDPAFAPERAASPKPALWIFIGFIAGLAFSLVIALFRKSPNAPGNVGAMG